MKTAYKGFAAAIFLTAFLLVGQPASAQTPAADSDPFAPLIQKIAETFKLDKAKVQSTFDQWHQQRHSQREAEMKQHRDTYLSGLVAQGKITEAQKQAIIAKQDELRKNFNPASMRGKTPDERRAAMQATQAELEAWARTQGIDPSYIPGMRMGKRMGFGHGARGQ